MRLFQLLGLLVFCLLLAMPTPAQAGHGHYVNGVEGLKAGTLPPPGFYWRMYNAYYTAGKQVNNSGRKAPGRTTADVYALVNRFIYSSEIEVLGANVVMDMIIPMTNTKIQHRGTPGEFASTSFGVGDILLEPAVLGWHGAWYDAALGFGVYLPCGDWDEDKPASAGKGFWTFMFTGGGTVYFDAARTWHASLLARYEVHTRQKDTHTTPGNDFHFEWGIGKTINEVLDVGVAGYCNWQVTDDSGGHNKSQFKERSFAIGPEIAYTIVPWGLGVSLRTLWEFENRNCTEGNITTLTLTKAF